MKLRRFFAIKFLLLLGCAAIIALAQSTPRINLIVPDHATAGAANTPIAVFGANLSGSIVFNGASLSTTFVSSTELTATVPSTSLAAIGSFAVHVGASNTLRFRVLSPLLGISYYTPTQFITPVNTPVAVFGSNFDSSSTILFDWQPITTTFVSSTELTGTVPSGLITSTQTHHILVYAGAFTAASIGTVQFLNVIGSDQPQIALSNVPIGTAMSGTATIRALQGTVTLSTPYQAISGPNAGDFSVTGGSCSNGKALASGSACNAQVTATPAAIPTPPPAWLPNNSYTLNYEIVDNANRDPNATPHLQKVTTAGTSGVNSPGIAGSSSPAWNETAGTTTEGPDTLVWTDQGPYAVTLNETATLTINSNAANNPQTVPLSVSKTLPAIGSALLLAGSAALNPAGYDFSSVVESTPTSRAITLQNAGLAFMTLGSPFYVISGTNAADFVLSGGTCANSQFLGNGSGRVSGPGQSCTFNLTFTPSTTAAETATLTLNWSSIGGSVGSLAQVLTGTGHAAATKIHLAWTATTSGSITGYNVYRGTQSGGPYTLLASPGNVTSYDDTTPVHGNTYCYVIASIGTSPPYTTTGSGNSNESCATF